MGAWQIVSCGQRVIKRGIICVASCIAMLKIGPILTMGLSMLLSIVVYAAAFGLKFAVGFVLLLLVHEYGHVIAAKVVGLRVSSPIFIPFIGAVIGIKDLPSNAKVEANVAIGGPAIGTLSALLCLALYFWSNNQLMLILSYTACLLNLFNLIPCDPLDGGRIAAAISPRLWWLGSIIMGLLFIYTYNVFVFIILMVSLVKVWHNNDGDAPSFYYKLTIKERLTVIWWYLGLIMVLSGTTLYIIEILNEGF